jgi:uncharacterized protein (DUF952 family)
MVVTPIYHIALEDDFAKGKESGLYQCASLKREGFIHCSLKEQLLDVANFIFKNQQGLLLMEINSDMVIPEIRYENLEGGTKLFPHIYGLLVSVKRSTSIF